MTGTLVHVAPDGATTSWHDAVLQFDKFVDHIAVLAEFDGATGALYLRPEGGGDAALLAHGVPPGGFDFGWQIPAIGYLADTVAGAGRLVIRQLDGGQSTEVDVGVTEFREVVSAERPGVAYLIGSGDQAGIWFAEP
jgi:hypothetical protein